MQLEIIVGVSFFGNGPCVGIALQHHVDAIGLGNWAESVSTTAWGRPACTQTLNGRSEGEQIAYLVSRWQAWAEANNVAITIATTPRKVGRF